MTLRVPALLTGSLARRLLLPAGRGRVLAATAGAVYLRTGDGGLLWIQGAGAPMHRRAVGLVGPAVPAAEAGAPFHVEQETLRIDPGVRIDMAGASTWEPVDLAGDGGPGVIDARVREFLGAIDAGRARELGGLIPALRRLTEEGAEALAGVSAGALAATGDPVLDAAAPHAIGAALACRALDPEALEGHARALVGLGRGLTPSGDDFVGGLLFVLRRLPRLCPASFPERACSSVGGWADRTNAISFAMLHDCAVGHGSAVEHEIVAGLGGALPRAGPGASVERLVGIGHSSGWDRLAGMVGALAALRPVEGEEKAWTSRI